MPRNGSGTMSVYTPGTPFVTQTVISSTVANNVNTDIATEITNSVPRDGQAPPTANLPMGTFRHTGVGNAAATTDYAAAGQVQNNSMTYGGNAGGSANTITISLTPPLGAYAAGQEFNFKATAANTGAATLNIGGLGAKTILKAGAALVANDILNGDLVTVIYDGTQFQMRIGAAGTTSVNSVTGTGLATATPTTGAVVLDVPLASQAEAEAGTENAKVSSPLRVAQAIAALQRAIASQAEAEAGSLNTVDMTPLRVAQAIDVQVLATANTYTKQQAFGVATLTDAATIAWNLNDAQSAQVTLGGNRTLGQPTNIISGGTYVLVVKQDATGSRTLAYHADYLFPGGTGPTLSTGANAIDVLTFVANGTKMLGVSQLAFA